MSFTVQKIYPDSEFEVRLIADSVTIKVGMAVEAGATGHTKTVTPLANVSHSPVGVVTAIQGVNGTITELSSVTTSSSNETTPVYYAQYLPVNIPGIRFWATLQNAAGTTSTDDEGFCSFSIDTSDATKLDETSYQLGSTLPAKQFVSFGVDTEYDNTSFTVSGVWSKYFQ